MADIINDYSVLLNKFIENLPEDKQKHFTISKALFNTVYPISKTQSISCLEAILQAFFIGYRKELLDKGVDEDAFQRVISRIKSNIKELDDIVDIYKLDEGDLNADLAGVISVALLHLLIILRNRT